MSETYYNYAAFLAQQNRNAEAREWAQKLLDKRRTMPGYLSAPRASMVPQSQQHAAAIARLTSHVPKNPPVRATFPSAEPMEQRLILIDLLIKLGMASLLASGLIRSVEFKSLLYRTTVRSSSAFIWSSGYASRSGWGYSLFSGWANGPASAPRATSPEI